MKELMKKKQNNKGFSLVELIVVIAIMVVLVAVLAPVFTKYVESSRRATDVQNANSIASAVKTQYVDTGDKFSGEVKSDNLPDGITEVQTAKGNAVEKGASFVVAWDGENVVVTVSNGTKSSQNLTTDAGAQAYKDAE